MNPTLWFKKLTMPLNNDVKQVDAVQCWQVRWQSRHGEFSMDTTPQVEVFTSRELAEEFATALERAFNLLRITSGNYVKVVKAA